MAKLPEGFVLDNQVPEGFVLDAQPEQPQGNLLQRTGSLALEAGKNLPGSTVEILNNIGLALMHPLDTAQTLGEVVFGGVEKLVPGEQRNEPQFDAVVQFFRDRYGSRENLNRTIAEDPAGVMADMSALLTGVGGVAKSAGQLAKTPGLAKTGQTLVRAGEATDPLNLAATGASKAIRPGAPEKMYASATKMTTSKTVSPELRAQNVRTGLEEGILPTQKGLEKLRGKIDDINQQINEFVSFRATQGDVVPRGEIIKRLQDLKKTKAFSDTPDKKLLAQAINKEIAKIRENFPAKIPVDKVQDLKTGIYQNIRNAYGKRASVVKEIRKATARGAKEVLAERYPELASLNRQDSALLELEKAIEQAAKRIENRDLINIGLPLKVLGGSVAGGATGSVEGLAAGIASGAALGLIDSPIVKSKLAIALEKARGKGLARNPRFYYTREGSRQAGRLQENLQEQ